MELVYALAVFVAMLVLGEWLANRYERLRNFLDRLADRLEGKK